MGGVNLRKWIYPAKVKPVMNNYHIPDVYFRPPVRHLHSSIDALLAIVKKNQFKLEEIDEIMVKTYKIAAEHNDYHPTSTEALKQSLPVTLAVALLNHYQGAGCIIEFSNSTQNQVEIDDISRKIQIKIDTKLDKEYYI